MAFSPHNLSELIIFTKYANKTMFCLIFFCNVHLQKFSLNLLQYILRVMIMRFFDGIKYLVSMAWLTIPKFFKRGSWAKLLLKGPQFVYLKLVILLKFISGWPSWLGTSFPDGGRRGASPWGRQHQQIPLHLGTGLATNSILLCSLFVKK